MSKRSDAADRAVAMAIANLRRSGYTNKEIALLQGVDVKRVPKLARLGETLLTIRNKP